MSGDLPPHELITGGIKVGRLRGCDVVFAGDTRTIEAALLDSGESPGRAFHILPSSEIVHMEDPPVQAVRQKPDSSMVRGLAALASGEVDAFVSPGNTGAVVAASLFTLGRIPGVPRPGILAPLPTLEGPDTYLIDVGATADCHAEHLVHFARMGATYVREVMGISSPSVGLLNIGAEPGKGNRLMAKTFDLLQSSGLRFIGNVEAHQVIQHRPADIVVSDGFTGNICLKAIEGSVAAVSGLLKRSIRGSVRARIGALLMKHAFDALRAAVSYQERGGAPLLGVNGIVVIAHGRSDAEAISSAMDVACREVHARLAERISQTIEEKGNHGS
jgi:glycerol-3-phosphate acyltransferase PlsX